MELRFVRRSVNLGLRLGARTILLALLVATAWPTDIQGVQDDSIQAAFKRRSYAPGDTARLAVSAETRRLTIRIFRVGTEQGRTRNDLLRGVAVGERRVVQRATQFSRPTILLVRLGSWPSGFYFARVGDNDGHVGFAPFVLRPRELGSTNVAVVLPTNTWQAYNRRDVDGDGLGDTWYSDPSVKSVDLTRSYLDRGVPPGFRDYHLGLLHWLAREQKAVDFLADDDLESFSDGDRLLALYDLIVFSGHEEYVTAHTYDLIERYRDLGGNLMFLSANNFYRRVVRRGQRLYWARNWRNLGRPEAQLIGIQYLGSDRHRFAKAPYVVTGAALAPWVFQGTGLENGDRFGRYGIEIDARASSSPMGVSILARIPNIFGRGRSAEMAYYTTRSGAKVFAAGAVNFCGTADTLPARRILENLWEQLSRP
jgi:hypothetical protein